MSSHEWNELNEIVKKAAKVVQDNEKFLVGVLAVRARKLAESYPTDQTAVGLSGFLNKRAQSQVVFITRAELRDVYGKLYTPNNKFAENFADELGISKSANMPEMKRHPKEGEDLVKDAYKEMADPILANQLSTAFDSSIPYLPYSADIAKLAQKTCAHELNCRGVLPKKISVVAGREDVLICQATYETPKGQGNALIPVEIKKGHALLPTMFLNTEGFVELSSENIKEHIEKTAGKSYKVNVQDLLYTILEAKGGAPEPLTEIERIIMKANAAKETPISHIVNAVLYQEVDAESPNVKVPEYEQPKEIQDFAHKLTSSAGVAEFVFGKDIVDKGRNIVRFATQKAGHTNVQVAVSDNNDDTIFYAVSIDGANGFNVPVKIANKQITEPKVAVAAGRIYELSAEGLSSLLSDGMTDQRAVAKTSAMYDVKPSELVNIIKAAMAEKNYLKAEDALNVLQASNNDLAFSEGYTAYVNGLRGVRKEASVQSKCSAPVKVASSKYLICSHTGLPVHKVYQDENGDCHPLYRKEMKDTATGASFLQSRIYWE